MATESRLAEIYRQELKKSGLLGALLSASGSRIKEKTDIRRMLPQSGVSGAAFEKMFGKPYKYGANKGSGVRDTKGGGSDVSKSMEEKLTRIGVDSKLTAKNTIVLPAMARDMNVMRLNMQKMVKLGGGTATKSSDMFFKRASDREAQYEGQYKRNSGGLAPTPVAGKKEGGGFLGMLGSLLGGAKDIVSAFGGFFKGLFGVILASGIIGQFLKDPETRANFLDFITKFLKGFFDGVKATFEVVGEALKDKDVQASIAGAIKAIFNAILEVFKVELTKIETPFGNLSITIGDVVGAFVGFKIAMFALETAILLRAANIGRGGGMDLPGGPDKGKGKGSGPKGSRGGWMRGLGTAVGIGVIGKGIQYYLEQNESEEDARRLAQEDIDNQARQSFSPGEEIAPKKPEGMRGSEIAGYATNAAVGASLLKSGLSGLPSASSAIPSAVSSPAASGKPLTSFGSVGANREMEKNKTLWEKIAKVMKKAYEKGASKIMLSKLGQKFGTWMAIKMATVAAGVIAAPFSAGASLLISAIGVGMLAKDVYDLYEWFIEYEKELDAYEKASSPTPVAADTTSAVSPSPTAAPAPKVTPGGDAKRGGSTSPTSSSDGSSYAERIGAREADGKYDTIFGKAGGAMINGKLVTENTIGEVGAWQADQKAKKTNKQAAGKYQFMDVMSAAKLAGLGPNDMFNGPNQEMMMRAYTDSNAKSLRAYGLPDTEEYLSMAHAVGPLGAKKLIDAQNAGKGNLNSLDILGLKGVAAETNPQLNTNVNATIAALKHGGPMGHGTALAKNNTPTGSTLASSQASLMEQQYRLMGGGTTVINAPTTNSVIGGSSGGANGNMNPYNGDLMKYLLRPIA